LSEYICIHVYTCICIILWYLGLKLLQLLKEYELRIKIDDKEELRGILIENKIYWKICYTNDILLNILSGTTLESFKILIKSYNKNGNSYYET